MKFTVILLYPTALQGDGSLETYFAFVKAKSFRDSIKKAQREAFGKLSPEDRRGKKVRDFRAVAVLRKHHQVLNVQMGQLLPLQPFPR